MFKKVLVTHQLKTTALEGYLRNCEEKKISLKPIIIPTKLIFTVKAIAYRLKHNKITLEINTSENFLKKTHKTSQN